MTIEDAVRAETQHSLRRKDRMIIIFDGDEAKVIHENCQDRVDEILVDGELQQHSFCG